ncbi:MAG: sixA, partial [Phenylobacterium sp.]|nr:sixA [Phenylobacterium sp.]
RSATTVMVVGHNPGLQELTVRLLMEGHAPASLISKAQGRFPTAAAAVFLFDDNGRAAYDGLFFPERGD